MTISEEKELESIQYPWAYKPFNDGYEIVYIKDGRIKFFLEGDDNTGIHTNETIVKHIVDIHNQWLKCE